MHAVPAICMRAVRLGAPLSLALSAKLLALCSKWKSSWPYCSAASAPSDVANGLPPPAPPAPATTACARDGFVGGRPEPEAALATCALGACQAASATGQVPRVHAAVSSAWTQDVESQAAAEASTHSFCRCAPA
jgi:hypothetical protein